MKKIKSIILAGLIVFIFLACDTPVALGKMLDLDGPVVEITSPVPRKAVPAAFTIEGTATDTSGIKSLVVSVPIKIKNDDDSISEFIKEWKYYNGKWEVSENGGRSAFSKDGLKWSKSGAKVTWAVPVDMTWSGKLPEDGEYLFSVLAEDSGGMSDENSLCTRVLIIDKFPPKVDITEPFIYRGFEAWKSEPLESLHDIKDDGLERFEPSNIGKFLTQGFNVQWQVDDEHDVSSIEFVLYSHDENIDQNPGTPLSDNYIYRYYINLPPPPPDTELLSSIKPNGRFQVPALDGSSTSPDGELKTKINEKTTVMLVAVCYDAAGNVNQEKVLGYFIYWPLADKPWIIYTEDMELPPEYRLSDDPLKYYDDLKGTYGSIEEVVKEKAFMIYPGRTIRATAYHNHGVEKINFDLYIYNELDGTVSEKIIGLGTDGVCSFCGSRHSGAESCIKLNEPRPNGSYSTIFPWEFRPPPRSGYFVIKATAASKASISSVRSGESREHIALFRVQDISFPDFPEPINPSASDPLFIHVDVDKASKSYNTVTISGIVRDATLVETLDMVWINPQSEGFATKSQIRYFREPEYVGWMIAMGYIDVDGNGEIDIHEIENPALPPLTPEDPCREEGLFDSANPNKLWRLRLNHEGEDSDTRQVYSFSITLNLKTDLNIAIDNQSLNSQTFLLKAKNPDSRCTIITYAPQGDESPPVINIDNVTVDDGDPYIPQQYALMPRFLGGETITINGSWREDSAEYLPIAEYFSGNFEAEINGIFIPAKNITVSYDDPAVKSSTGTWKAVIVVGSDGINDNDLLDSLVIEVKTKDFGGNVTTAGGSWLVESDDLRLLRISSSDDGTKKAGDKVTVFLEFSKAVQLRYTNSTPVLLLNSTGAGGAARAVYILNESLSTRHEFEYTVLAGNNTPVNTRLNVDGIEGGSSNWNLENYPFTWVRGSGETREEIRVTMNAAHAYDKVTNNVVPNNSVTPSVAGRLYARRLPVTTVSIEAEYQFTLGAGKNIIIDTQAPTVTGIEDTISGTTAHHYKAGADIYIKVSFSENVKVGSALPQLQLRFIDPANPALFVNSLTSGNDNDVRVSGQDITFKYTVAAGNTTGNNPIVITGHTGEITDLAGTPLASTGISSLPEGTAISAATNDRTIQNRFINTIKPGVPTVRLLSANNTGNVVENIVSGAARAGISTANINGVPNTAAIALSNVYHPELWIAIEHNNASATGGATFSGDNNLLQGTTGGLVYSVIDSTSGIERSWVKAPNVVNNPFEGLQAGTYRLVARQINRAGIESDETQPITFTWNPGNLISRVDSTTPNGTYSNITVTNKINVTMYLRDGITISTAAASSIRLNTTTGDGYQVTGSVLTNQNSFAFDYQIISGHNTPGSSVLDVNSLAINATDKDGVNVNQYLTLPAVKLGNRAIYVQTGALALHSDNNEPAWSTTQTAAQIKSDDSWTGSIALTFNRNIAKGNGSITITQQASGYRLPAVLTDAQSNRYKGIDNFNEFYSRGVNGFTSGAPDTSTKWILRYDISASVTPANHASPANETQRLQKLAWDFRQAESIQLHITSNDITINNDVLTINLTGSNALQVLGASYDIIISSGFVQDALNYSWPATANETYTHTAPEVNRPFVRVDKKTDKDRITSQTGSNTSPALAANFSNVLQTTARIDCRTPNSTIRYNTASQRFDTTGQNGTATGITTPGTAANWRNSVAAANAVNYLTQPALAETGDSGTVFSTDITVGDNTEHGFVWRISTRSRAGSSDSDIFEEIAFRTVLTYELANFTMDNAALQQYLYSGDQIWIRGGDAIGSSSIPGFPLTWDDDWDKLKSDKKRAGIRLLRLDTTGLNATNFNTGSQWKWITWEINVRTWFDIIKGIATARDNTVVTVTQNEAWQYGPKQRTYQRGGWTMLKDDYTLYPGQHRWIRANNNSAITGGSGVVSFSVADNIRLFSAVDISFTQPNP